MPPEDEVPFDKTDSLSPFPHVISKVYYMNGDELAKFWDQESIDHRKLLTEFEKEGLKIKE